MRAALKTPSSTSEIEELFCRSTKPSVTLDVRLQFYGGDAPCRRSPILTSDAKAKKIALQMPLSKPADVTDLIRRLADQAYENAET